MSHFVQRLLARHLGTAAQPPSGAVVMTPRVASRFESFAPAPGADMVAADTATEAVAGRPHVQTPKAEQASSIPPNLEDKAKALQQPAEDTLATGLDRERPLPDTELSPPLSGNHQIIADVRVPKVSRADPGVAEPARDGPLPLAAASRSATVSVAARLEPSQSVEGVPQDEFISRPRQPAQSVERTTSGTVADVSPYPEASIAHAVANASSQVAPQISIGRIDVQFLPPAAAPASPRQSVQRTRGFDSYASARRGQLR